MSRMTNGMRSTSSLKSRKVRGVLAGTAGAIGVVLLVATAGAKHGKNGPPGAQQPGSEQLITGKFVSAAVTQRNVGSIPVNLILSPDGKYAISTDTGFHEFLTALRTSDGSVASQIEYPTTNADSSNGVYYGLAFGSDGKLYAAQGEHQTIAVVNLAPDGTLSQVGSISTQPHDFPSGLAADSKNHLFVANNDSDQPTVPSSVAIYDITSRKEIGRYTFSNTTLMTPNFPYAIAALSDGSKVFVGSQRDAAVYVLDTSDPTSPKLADTIQTGSHPIALLLNKKQDKLFVANAGSDTISEVDASSHAVLSTLLMRPGRLAKIPGVTPDGLALSSDEKTLYVTLGDLNAVGVVSVGHDDLDLQGYIPAGWYPSAVVVGGGGSKLLFANAKGSRNDEPSGPVVTRYPNPGYHQYAFNSDPQYDQNQIRGGVTTIDVPSHKQLEKYTQQVLELNGAGGGGEGEEQNQGQENGKSKGHGKDAAALGHDNRLDSLGLKSGKIKHIIYIVKENRTYDQVLGDLPQGNGDPSLVLFGRNVTPNLHALAERFALLDNFYDCGEVSGDGWPWSTQAMANEYVIKNLPYNYSNRGRNYDFEGQINGYPAGGFPASFDGKTMSDVFPNGLPPIPDVAAAPGGHIWDLVQKAGTSYRNYGFFCNFGVTQKVNGKTLVVIPDNYPADGGLQPGGHDLAGVTDFDFRRYDAAFADSDATYSYGDSYPVKSYGKHGAQSRFQEWNTEFQEMLAKDPTGGAVPALMTVRFMHDHTQGMSAGVHSPRAQVADNDYACGQLVEAISKSSIWDSTAIFIIEDDSQDGPDHIDVHRSTCYVVSPWIKKGIVDHAFHNTDSVLKTIEMLLGLSAMTTYDAAANPILDWDDRARNDAPYSAIAEDKTIVTEKNPTMAMLKPGDKRIELVKLSDKMDFAHPDSAPSRQLNEIIWKSVRGVEAKMPEPKRSFQLALNNRKTAGKDADD